MPEPETQQMQRKRGWRRLIPIVIPVLIITVLITAETIISNNPMLRGSEWYTAMFSFTILNINVIMILVLLVVIFRNLVKLLSERKQNILGSRFRTKLIFTMIAVIIVPTVLVYIIASDLISKSIDRWYEGTVEQIVRSSENLSGEYLQDYENLLVMHARGVSEYISRENLLNDDKVIFLRVQYLEPLMDNIKFDVVEIYRGDQLFDSTIVNPDSPLLPYLKSPGKSRIEDVLKEKKGFLNVEIWNEEYPAGTLVRILVPIFHRAEDREDAIGVVAMGFGINRNLAGIAQSISKDYHRYRDQIDNREVVKFSSQGLLLLFTLISLFSAVWVGIYFSRSITVPIQQLAEATKAVASGDLDYRVVTTKTDELGILASSFNEMTKDLKDSKEELEEANRNLLATNLDNERRRRYTETLLSNLSTAVLSLDDGGKLTTGNTSACELLNIDFVNHIGQSWEDIFDRDNFPPLHNFLYDYYNCDAQSMSREINLRLDKKLLHLTATVTSIRHDDGTLRGSLIVLDDLTQLVRAQRTAAWQEVAQRIAHEIKNPLTPIQLSAERIRRKLLLAGQGSEGNRKNNGDQMELISTCTDTIIEETGTLKSLVNSFSSFARLPQVQLVQENIVPVLQKATSIYTSESDDDGGFHLNLNLESDLPSLDLDPDQLKMAFVNLINNAIDAMEGQGNLTVNCFREKAGNRVVIEFIDDGPGIPAETKDKLFLPYFSTKKKGTGLGLAIVSRIISDHHGTISVTDNNPTGAVFTITLPIT